MNVHDFARQIHGHLSSPSRIGRQPWHYRCLVWHGVDPNSWLDSRDIIERTLAILGEDECNSGKENWPDVMELAACPSQDGLVVTTPAGCTCDLKGANVWAGCTCGYFQSEISAKQGSIYL